jgi:hypothetical protein
MPLNHENSKFHQKLKFNGLDLVDFSDLEIWWQIRLFAVDSKNKKRRNLKPEISLSHFLYFLNYSRFLIAFVASSKPGFSSSANMFFLYASTPG